MMLSVVRSFVEENNKRVNSLEVKEYVDTEDVSPDTKSYIPKLNLMENEKNMILEEFAIKIASRIVQVIRQKMSIEEIKRYVWISVFKKVQDLSLDDNLKNENADISGHSALFQMVRKRCFNVTACVEEGDVIHPVIMRIEIIFGRFIVTSLDVNLPNNKHKS